MGRFARPGAGNVASGMPGGKELLTNRGSFESLG
jgi:hypothetical protein